MSSIRGRAIKVGGVATEAAGFSARTESDGAAGTPILRPAYRSAQGVSQPTAPLGGGSGVSLLDLSGVPAWRMIAVAAALLWLGFVFVSFRGGISGGVRV